MISHINLSSHFLLVSISYLFKGLDISGCFSLSRSSSHLRDEVAKSYSKKKHYIMFDISTRLVLHMTVLQTILNASC